MWLFVTVIGSIVLELNLVLSQSLVDNTGPIDVHARIGTVPQKYPVLDYNDQKASHKIITLVEMMRPAFPTGFGPVPPLDPYTKKDIEPISLNVPNLLFSGKVYLKNIKVTGAQQLSVQSVEMRMKNSRADARINVPELVAEVDFGVRAAIGILPINFGGHLRIVFTDASVVAAMGFAKRTFDNMQVFQLATADVHAHAQNVQIKLTSFHLGDGMESIHRDFLINKYINELKDDIALAVVREAMDEINSMLTNITADQVIAILLS